jgi:hypothetical protein
VGQLDVHDPSSEVKKDPEEHDVQPLLDELVHEAHNEELHGEQVVELEL